MSLKVPHFVAGIAMAAIAVSAWLYSSAGGVVDDDALRAAIVFSTLGTFAQFLSYQLARGASGSVAFIPYLTIIALAPSWIASVAVAVSIAVVQLTARRPPQKVVFNISQQALSVGLSVIAYTAAGGVSLIQNPRLSLLPFLALLLTFTLCNTISVSAVVALSEDRSAIAVWKDNTAKTIAYDLLSLPVVFAFAWVYVKTGPTGVAVLAVPVLGVRQLYITNWQLERTNQELLELMVAAIEARDPYTSGHSRRVAHYAKIIARAVGLGGREVDRVGVAALLHDVGKIHEVFAPILRKPDRLTPEEWDIMKTHPIKSAELVQHVSQLRDVVASVKHHHENWDGTGYPDGLAGEDIPVYARVIMFADTIDAMTTDRPYRPAMGESEVRDEIVRMRARQFDPRVCDLLLNSPLYTQLFQQQKPILTPRRVRSIEGRPGRKVLQALR